MFDDLLNFAHKAIPSILPSQKSNFLSPCVMKLFKAEEYSISRWKIPLPANPTDLKS